MTEIDRLRDDPEQDVLERRKVVRRSIDRQPMDWTKLADAFEEIGMKEARLAWANRTIDPECANRQLIGGSMCCHIAVAIRTATTGKGRAR